MTPNRLAFLAGLLLLPAAVWAQDAPPAAFTPADFEKAVRTDLELGFEEPLGEAHEGKAKWMPAEFTALQLESRAATSTRGQPVAYDLVTGRTGAAADLLPVGNARRANMDFIIYDYWVIRAPESARHYHQVLELAAGARPLAGERTTVWHPVGGLHAPRDEDFGPGGVDAARGGADRVGRVHAAAPKPVRRHTAVRSVTPDPASWLNPAAAGGRASRASSRRRTGGPARR